MNDLTELLISWLVAGMVLFLLLHRDKGATVGLPLAYFLGLFIIHWPGAATYLVPEHSFYDYEIVVIGLRLSTLALGAFVLGVWLGGLTRPQAAPASNSQPDKSAAPPISSDQVAIALAQPENIELTGAQWKASRLMLNYLQRHRDIPVVRMVTHLLARRLAVAPNPVFDINGVWVAKALLVAGLFIQLILMPALGGVATLTAILAGMAGLSVAGVCLGIHCALTQGNNRHLRVWILVALCFPVITLASSAFVGFGVHALIVVLAFVLIRTRVSGGQLLVLMLAAYIGISFFVTYMRDRSEIREAIWYEQIGYADRAKQLSKLVTDFELFDVSNSNHLDNIDRRLNQNFLVGMVAEHIATGNIDFAYGETVWFALVALIPRAVWPDKPAVGGGGQIVAEYSGLMFEENTSVGAGQVLEFYVNFGTWGVAFGFVILGFALRQFDMRAANAMVKQDYRMFLIWFLCGLGFLQAGGNLVEVTTSVAAGMVAALIAGGEIERRLLSRKSIGGAR